MPLTTENTAALLPGGVPIKETHPMLQQKPGAQPATLRVEVLRAFYFQGELLAVKSKQTLPRVFALEMAAANKVRVVEEEPAKAEAPASQAAAKAAPHGEQEKRENRK